MVCLNKDCKLCVVYFDQHLGADIPNADQIMPFQHFLHKKWKKEESKKIDAKFSKNGMLRHSLGGSVIFISLPRFIAPALDLIPFLLALPSKEGGNKGIK